MRGRAFLIAFAMASTAAAAPPAETGRDALDRPVAELVNRGLPSLVLYTNRNTRNSIETPAAEMAARLRDVPFVTVVRVDLRDVPGLLRGVAKAKLRASQRDGTARFIQSYRSQGLTPPSDAAERLAIVGDFDGAPQKKQGLPEGFNEARAVVYDSSGEEMARGPFPRDLQRIERAVREAGRQRAAAR